MRADSPSQELLWGDDPITEPASGALIVDVDGFEGPLDLLLTLARQQRVDLAAISILDLVEQYLAFIREARGLSLELAADYLVMAAWLAYLKSRLLLPEPESEDEPSGEELAQHLAFRLQRLEAMRNAARQLFDRPRLGRDIAARGMPEGIRSETTSVWQDTLYDLLAAYARERVRTSVTEIRFSQRKVMDIAEAREMLVRFIGASGHWTSLDGFLIAYVVAPGERRSALASGFTASLELVRDGAAEMKQDGPFRPLMLRSAEAPG